MRRVHNYFVICREDRLPDLPNVPGRYVLCRSNAEPFHSLREAREYAQAVNPSREPRILFEVK